MDGSLLGGSKASGTTDLGRWPSNVAVDEDVAELIDEQSGVTQSRVGKPRTGKCGVSFGLTQTGHEYSDIGGASRFFYCPKTKTEAREAGCETLPLFTAGEITGGRKEGSAALDCPRTGAGRTSKGRHNYHPTVKPIELMRWLVRLVTPPGGTVLDPFAGSGTTAIACLYEGAEFVGVEREADYVRIHKARVEHWQRRFRGGPLLAGLP